MVPDNDDRVSEPVSNTALERLRSRFLARWREFPAERRAELDSLLSDALDRAGQAEPEVITVMNPVSRPMRLALGVLVTDAALDTMYSQEWGELSVSRDGRCYLVYRRRDGAHYAIEWTAATTMPASMLNVMPDVLAMAMLEGDADGEG